MKYTEEQLTNLAKYWMLEMRDELPSGAPEDIGQRVLVVSFGAPPENQWFFVLEAIKLATSEDELGHIAAGPLEHLLGFHGENYIELVEERAEQDPKFSQTLTGVWKHKMTDEVWERVRKIQEKVEKFPVSKDKKL